jgi:hypothetical protein
MTAIEILATITASWILVKLIIFMINPKAAMKLAESMFRMRAEITALYIVLAVVVGYFILTSLSIVQVTAVMLFAAILFGLGLLPYSETMLKLTQEMSDNRAEMLRKNWLAITIWVVIALWTLCAVFIQH